MKNHLDKFSDHANCPIRHVLDRFGDKWSIIVIEMLGERGKLRFTEISQNIGDISQKMLTVTLRSLEADGLVFRKHFPEIPPRVEYELTATGKSLLPQIEGLSDWAIKNMDTILKNRKRFLAKQENAKDAKSAARATG